MQKNEVYQKGKNAQADAEFAQVAKYGNVKLGQTYLFWKSGLRWNMLALEKVERAFRRIEGVNTKMCCGNVNFDIQKLVLVGRDGTEIEARIGDGMPREAETLYEELKRRRPEISYGKEEA